MTKLIEWDCDFCKHCDCDEYTEPCRSCKNNQRPSSKEYQTAPLLFELQDAPAIEDNGETIDIAEAIEKMGAAAEETVGKITAAVKKIHIPEAALFHSCIKDSGDRTEFTTGAVRDMHTGKGRMDLLPVTAIIELSKHCENGAIKYGERNVDKGIPQHSFIDSGLRHLFKYLRGDKDENHLVAALWNIAWAVEQEVNKPELIDLPNR